MIFCDEKIASGEEKKDAVFSAAVSSKKSTERVTAHASYLHNTRTATDGFRATLPPCYVTPPLRQAWPAAVPPAAAPDFNFP
jgi:hypothetical protein